MQTICRPKIPTKTQVLTWLRQGRLGLPPLAPAAPTRRRKGTTSAGADETVMLRWGGQSFLFAVQCRALSTPLAIAEAVAQAQRAARSLKMLPMIVVPYLSTEKIEELSRQEVSGLDLCGNGVVIVPDKVLVTRTGNPNRFPRSGAIKNVYRGESAMAARLFLLQPSFDSVGAALAELRRRGGTLTLPTISKVCQQLEADLILERQPAANSKRRRLRLLQPDKLFERLAAEYRLPQPIREEFARSRTSQDAILRRLANWEDKTGNRIVRTGSCSTVSYAVMAREPVLAVYCTDVESARAALGEQIEVTNRFADLRLIETRESVVYFDCREDFVASPIQTFLELCTGDKRERETAAQVREFILRNLTAQSEG
jgi:hypothetical protein